jgi:pyruvate/2-oxoglutarate dehydrogenase complex dihydrolipoamide acyltransferase (E2) component
MKITLRVPKSAVSSQQGQLAEWHVEDGGVVNSGDPIYSIELEKTTLEVPAPFKGRISYIATVGETYPVGAPIADFEKID